MEGNCTKEKEFINYIYNVREDYEKQEKKWKRVLHICRIVKVILLAIIPIISFLNNHLVILICSGIIAILEFLPSYFKCEEKLIILNEAITKINFEYQTYYYNADEQYKNEIGFNVFVNKIEKIIFDTELKINSNYNSDAYDNITINRQ